MKFYDIKRVIGRDEYLYMECSLDDVVDHVRMGRVNGDDIIAIAGTPLDGNWRPLSEALKKRNSDGSFITFDDLYCAGLQEDEEDEEDEVEVEPDILGLPGLGLPFMAESVVHEPYSAPERKVSSEPIEGRTYPWLETTVLVICILQVIAAVGWSIVMLLPAVAVRNGTFLITMIGSTCLLLAISIVLTLVTYEATKSWLNMCYDVSILARKAERELR